MVLAGRCQRGCQHQTAAGVLLQLHVPGRGRGQCADMQRVQCQAHAATGDLLLVQMALRNLAVAKRGYPTLLKKDLVTGIQTVLKRAKEVVDPLNPSECAAAHTDSSVSFNEPSR